MGRYIGTRNFYKKAFTIALPIVIQNGITAFVGMLDNIMVGRLGTDAMSGVAIANQLVFIFNLLIFGGLSGAGIFGAQFFGKKDYEGVRHTTRFKLYMVAILSVVAIVVFYVGKENLVSMYLHEGGDVGDPKATLAFGASYLNIMLINFIPFGIAQVYASTLRECGETVLPMRAGMVAVVVNLCLNYVLIYGKLGAPALGSDGAAIATVIARFAECAVIMATVHKNKEKYAYFQGLYRSFRIPGAVIKGICITGLPLLVNETMWSIGIAAINQGYSYRGLEVIAAINITSTISNLFNVIYIAMGSVVAIMVGQLLGAGKREEAIDTDRKLLFFAVGITVVIGAVMSLFAGVFPEIYKTEQAVQSLATKFILISSLALPLQAYCHSAYFTMRAGGKTFVTMLFDSVYMWVIVVPTVYIISRHTQMPVVWMYLTIQGNELIKCIIGYFILRSGSWANNIVEKL